MRCFSLFLVILVLLCQGCRPALADNPYGVMLWSNGEDPALLLARARGLGVAWYRPPAIFVDQWSVNAPCPTCTAFQRTELKLALTVRNGGHDFGSHQASTPPQSAELFKRNISSILDAWKPALLVVENEESNTALYFDANPRFQGYGQELEIACAAAHERKIDCANGGLSATDAALLTWRNFMETGHSDQACDFAKRSLLTEDEAPLKSDLCATNALDHLPQSIMQSLERLAPLVAIYRTGKIDQVNFHWHGRDARALAEVAVALGKITGKPVMTNEIRQERWNANSTDVRPLLRAVFASQMRVAIWYSIDTPTTLSLFELDGRLRPSGWEFQRHMTGRK